MSLAVLCPGQGGQHAVMFARVADAPAAAAAVAAAHSVLGTAPQTLAADPGRYANAIAQPLVCAGTLAHWQVLRAQLPTPLLVLGYSVGELAAHAVAGSMSIETCLQLAATRARLMDAASPQHAGLMAVVGLPLRVVEMLCQTHGAALAIINGDDHAVLGGPSDALQALGDAATSQGARVTLLPVSVPAHTPWLRAAADGFAVELATAQPIAPTLRVLAGIDARAVSTQALVIDTLSRQIAQTVRWYDVLVQAAERGARVFLELGPGSALARMAREVLPACEARSVDDFHSTEGVVEWVNAACERAA
ncbi:malonate decarboxylase subunit epsilon [Xanthomonas nasturtii]|uniref:Malonate decarboxylase subunit epsilon n=1 Tax=Xanthomonas nasturtii TaxID=1843581 RepID=A0A3E1KJB2_9XANT|nr:malonate decarboxylase subunit epsilon [Xanthomonas nasturtii]MCL1499749.1 malonate decarboxylase subunit epsilon [Xanthomonas nasturtii]MCL1503417.1 malonate decarboxylase subunit epsilon [Xanthomonas nasturtii]MCL1521487.1 malonate decarboxylase subunit epsilon [Xanthomonas nasturtii]MCL1527411.1 malonate decarboxylase subunit epsilon [Xanthomonas nasturtii]MCL1531311.1 malonate decarboxylase subunit epsilon [Xanthomonas nasturtii]